jgi:hypothetical protein
VANVSEGNAKCIQISKANLSRSRVTPRNVVTLHKNLPASKIWRIFRLNMEAFYWL